MFPSSLSTNIASPDAHDGENWDYGGDGGSGGDLHLHERVAEIAGDATHSLQVNTARVVEKCRRDVFPFLSPPGSAYEFMSCCLLRLHTVSPTTRTDQFSVMSSMRRRRHIRSIEKSLFFTSAIRLMLRRWMCYNLMPLSRPERTSPALISSDMARNDIPIHGEGIGRSRIQKLRLKIELPSKHPRHGSHIVDKIRSTFNKT